MVDHGLWILVVKLCREKILPSSKMHITNFSEFSKHFFREIGTKKSFSWNILIFGLVSNVSNILKNKNTIGSSNLTLCNFTDFLKIFMIWSFFYIRNLCILGP